MELPGSLGPGKRIASIFLLPQCAMSCRFCASELDFSTMTSDQALGLLGALQGKVESLVLGGGEPFLWPHDLPGLAVHAERLGFHVQVCTNGVSLPSGFEGLPGIARFILPLESMDPVLHDGLRVYQESHHAIVMRRLDALSGSGREVTISTVVTRENVHALRAIAGHLRDRMAQGLRIHAWHLYRFLPVGRGGAIHGQELAVAPLDYLDACRAMKAEGLGFPVYRRDDMLRSSSVAFFWFEGENLRMAGGG